MGQLVSEMGFSYEEGSDRYFMQKEPSWDTVKRIEKGRRQGAIPASSVEEFTSGEEKYVDERMQRAVQRAIKRKEKEDENIATEKKQIERDETVAPEDVPKKGQDDEEEEEKPKKKKKRREEVEDVEEEEEEPKKEKKKKRREEEEVEIEEEEKPKKKKRLEEVEEEEEEEK